MAPQESSFGGDQKDAGTPAPGYLCPETYSLRGYSKGAGCIMLPGEMAAGRWKEGVRHQVLLVEGSEMHNACFDETFDPVGEPLAEVGSGEPTGHAASPGIHNQSFPPVASGCNIVLAAHHLPDCRTAQNSGAKAQLDEVF